MSQEPSGGTNQKLTLSPVSLNGYIGFRVRDAALIDADLDLLGYFLDGYEPRQDSLKSFMNQRITVLYEQKLQYKEISQGLGETVSIQQKIIDSWKGQFALAKTDLDSQKAKTEKLKSQKRKAQGIAFMGWLAAGIGAVIIILK